MYMYTNTMLVNGLALARALTLAVASARALATAMALAIDYRQCPSDKPWTTLGQSP